MEKEGKIWNENSFCEHAHTFSKMQLSNPLKVMHV